MKFSIGGEDGRCEMMVTVVETVGGSDVRSIELGVMPLTPGTGRVSVTVSAALPIRLKVGALPVCCQTWAWTGPADSPGRFGVIARAGVQTCTVQSRSDLACRLLPCASSVVPRLLFT